MSFVSPRANILVLDNDETTGSYFHVVYYMFNTLCWMRQQTMTDDEVLNHVVEYGLLCGAFRPGIEDFLADVVRLKREGRIHAVVMYTNAYAHPDWCWKSKTMGNLHWGHFVAAVLSRLGEVEKLFDVILTRRAEHSSGTYYPRKSFQRVIDSLPQELRSKRLRIVFFDDRPAEIDGKNEHCIAVPVIPYKSSIPYEGVRTAVNHLTRNNEMKVAPDAFHMMIKNDWYTTQPDPHCRYFSASFTLPEAFNGIRIDYYFPQFPSLPPIREEDTVIDINDTEEEELQTSMPVLQFMDMDMPFILDMYPMPKPSPLKRPQTHKLRPVTAYP